MKKLLSIYLFAFMAGSNNLSSIAWYSENSSGMTHPVKQKDPNELGLYDMSGNVYEWCNDWKGAYSSSSLTNPQGLSLSASRVRRGGGYCHYDKYSRVSFRSCDSPYVSNYFIGMRLSL